MARAAMFDKVAMMLRLLLANAIVASIACAPVRESELDSSDDAGPSNDGDPGDDKSDEQELSERVQVFEHRVGFARDTTGGAAGSLLRVTTLDDSGPGSLREAIALDEPAWIIFDVSGEIELSANLDVTSNKTIDGRSASITLRNFGIRVIDVENVIVENLRIEQGVGDARDAIAVFGSNNVWIDHCTLADFPVSALDISRATADKQRVSVSWSRFENQNTVMSIGLPAAERPGDGENYLSLANSYFRRTATGHPDITQAYTHIFNSVFEEWGVAVGTSSEDARLLFERNHFVAGPSTQTVVLGAVPGSVRAVGDRYVNGAQPILDARPMRVSTPGYEYSLWETTECNRAQVQDHSGQQAEPMWPEPC